MNKATVVETKINYQVDSQDEMQLDIHGDESDILVGVAEIIANYAVMTTEDKDSANVLAALMMFELPQMVACIIDKDSADSEETV